MTPKQNDHGGGLDAAILRFGGVRSEWLDLSTGINPLPYGVGKIPAMAWTALPDSAAQDALIAAARRFWQVPDGAAVLAAPGASCLIANMPRLAPKGRVTIAGPTYNEHASAFASQGWQVGENHETAAAPATAQVVVHPNNPDGRTWQASDLTAPLRIIDESFCDVMPDQSLMAQSLRSGTIILKSFGKFWGLAGLRLGFAIGDPDLIAQLQSMLGPWPVSGPAQTIGARALNDTAWAQETRTRLATDAARLDRIVTAKGATCVGGTDLFRLYDVGDAQAWQDHLARAHIWSRVFPYNPRWLRLGLPHPLEWARLEAAV